MKKNQKIVQFDIAIFEEIYFFSIDLAAFSSFFASFLSFISAKPIKTEMSPQNAAKHGVNPFKNEIMSEVQFKPRQENTQNPIRTIPINNETIKYSIIVLAVLVKTKTAFYKKIIKLVIFSFYFKIALRMSANWTNIRRFFSYADMSAV